ncbi:hypothetical protein JQ604_28080 [Bradyrhizobium jicamae]|uniref:DUF6622 family protein n=1 Tax=Bradyrhizobium jicamae TaxID=280332 RepID=UPI001BAAFF8B|nr:DUF6622 family protein [Bradyrhizobium jicamae]MBR0756050.1 hypothetical protein [Bradyrhizobium jicamae]
MPFAYGILTHTPLWAWLLLGYLVWQGIKATQPRTTTIWRALIVPAVFIVWGVSRLGLRQDSIWPLIAWGTAVVALVPVGILTPRPFELDHKTGQIMRPGSLFPLVRNLVVFGLQYAVAVISAIDVHDRLLAAIVGRTIAGATSGYFIGSAIALLLAYQRKRQHDAGA